MIYSLLKVEQDTLLDISSFVLLHCHFANNSFLPTIVRCAFDFKVGRERETWNVLAVKPFFGGVVNLGA